VKVLVACEFSGVVREAFAHMMIRQSLSTGHGDTVGDLVREVEPQIAWLRAELVEKQADCVGYDARNQVLRDSIASAQNDVSDLIAERDRLRKDAERYRWLRGDGQHDSSSRWMRWRIEHWGSHTWNDLRGAELDDAIDAALGGEKKDEA
jgi:hypothetical protein